MAIEKESTKALQELTNALADEAADNNENSNFHKDRRAGAEQKVVAARESEKKPA